MLVPLLVSKDWIVPEKDRLFGTPYKTEGRKSTDLIVFHWTACPYVTVDDSNYERIKKWLTGGGSKSSTHFCILRSGRIIQSVSLMDTSWNSGNSEWCTSSGKKIKKSVNQYSIGIDFDNIGPLTKKGDVFFDCYGSKWNGRVKSIDGEKSFYEPYTPEQIISACYLLKHLVHLFGINIHDVVGHKDVSPGRKIDPGPLFPRFLVTSLSFSDKSQKDMEQFFKDFILLEQE